LIIRKLQPDGTAGHREMVLEFAGAAGRQRESLLACRAVAFEDVECG